MRAVNGGLIAVARVPALVITLGTLYAFRGVDYYWASGRQINAADMPPSFLRLGNQTVLGVPVLFLVALVVVAAVGFYLRSYRSGRELYAIGSNLPPPGSPASRWADGSSPSSSPAVPSPGSPACCTRPGSAPSTRPPAPAWNSRSSPPQWSAGWRSSAAAAAPTARHSAPCC
ncbi:hypothetical protein NKG94_00555 [Micromonospora sp. M12]